MDKSPSVFVIYSNSDLDDTALAVDFGTKLRKEFGVDARVREWEIRPGDSIVDKVFEEGIGEAVALVVLVTASSLQDAWFRAQLDVGKVRQIEERTRLIPVVVGDNEVPQSLRATHFVRIEVPNNLEDAVHQVAATVYGIHDRPELGPIPPYALNTGGAISGLSPLESAILRAICEIALERDDPVIKPTGVWARAEKLAISEEDFTSTLEVLAEEGYIRVQKVSANFEEVVALITLTAAGFITYEEANVPEYPTTFKALVAHLVNERTRYSGDIAKALGRPQIEIDLILESLQAKGLVRLLDIQQGGAIIEERSPRLRRLLP